MFLVEVIPIKKSFGKETLSYISTQKPSEGSIILIPVKQKQERGLVVSVSDARSQKTHIKKLDFALKSITSDDEVLSAIPTPLFNTFKHVSIHYAIPLGSVISSCIKNELFDIGPLWNQKKHIKGEGFEIYAIQQKEKERFDIYKSIIRESFAKKQSVFVVGPSEIEAEKIFEYLKKGIEDFAIYNECKSQKQIKEILRQVELADIHPLLIVGGIQLLPLIPKNTGVIIVDAEQSRFYRRRKRPHIDERFLLEMFARESKMKIFFGDLLLRIETHQKIQRHLIQEYGIIPRSIEHSIKTLTVDLRQQKEKTFDSKKTFHVFSDELKEMIMYALKKKKKMFLFGLRRGVASQTICLDCGNIVLCDHCNTPVVLHKKTTGEKTDFTFICHHCGKKRDSFEVCKTCGSWRLESFGIGIQKIVEEVTKLTGKTPFLIESDSVNTKTKAKKIIQEFEKQSGIIVGTEMAFNYLQEESVDYSAIVSFDSLFSLPDFRANEHIMRIILKTKLLAKEFILLQGRNVSEKIIDLGITGNVSTFVKEELTTRNKFNYPPFSTFIKITIEQKKEIITNDIKIIQALFASYTPLIFPAFIKTKHNYVIAHILLTTTNTKWPDQEMREKLLSLPPYMTVSVNPESLL